MSPPISTSTLLTVLVPMLGSTLGWILGFSPIPQLIRDARGGQLTKDPTPYPVAFTCNFAWALLGLALDDPWPTIGNLGPIMANLFATITALRLCADPRVANRIQLLTMAGMGLLLALSVLTLRPWVVSDADGRAKIAGYAAMSLCFAQFSSPLVEVKRAITSGDASSLSLPLATTGVACTLFWAAYGLSVSVPAIWIPNGGGCILSVFVCLIKLRYYRGRAQIANESPREILLKHCDTKNGVRLRSIGLQRDVSSRSMFSDQSVGLEQSERLPNATPFASHDEMEGLVLHAVRAGDAVAFRTRPGYFLSVVSRGGEGLPSYLLAPTDLLVKSVACTKAGPSSWFLPIEGYTKERERASVHEYAEASVAFYNEHHRVFMRLNENGELDCSAPINPPQGREAQDVILPAGWLLERFSVSRAGPAAMAREASMDFETGVTSAELQLDEGRAASPDGPLDV